MGLVYITANCAFIIITALYRHKYAGMLIYVQDIDFRARHF